MVPQELHRNLFDALKPGAGIRVFGDDNQLAPVEEDKRLRDEPSPFLKILQNQAFTSVILDQVFRQGADSGILFNAQQILKGRYPSKNEQWGQCITNKPTDALREYVMDQLVDEEIDFGEIENQIIVPQNTTWVGTRKLNTMLQGLFHNERDPCLWLDRHDWVEGEGGTKGGKIRVYKGDKVIVTSNLYDLGVFNGETGKVIEVDEDTGELVIDFGDREQSIPPVLLVQTSRGGQASIDPRKHVDLAYAITTHKSQGSEFRRVVYLLNRSNTFSINRRNFYTAVTRAKEHVYLIADQQGLGAAVTKKK
jgi:exodeoxyribonuclease V alpha subunit